MTDRNKKKTPERYPPTPWTVEEEVRFKAAWLDESQNAKEIAQRHGRTLKAVQLHARLKGYPKKGRSVPIRWVKGSPLSDRLYDLYILHALTAEESAEILARETGTVVTRNIVIGVSKRLKWDKKKRAPSKAPARAAKPKSKPAPKLVVMANTTVIEAGTTPPKYEVKAKAWDVLPGTEPKTIWTRGNGCKWPVGNASGADQMFCAQPTDEGKSYCAHHREVGFVPSSGEKELRRGLRRYV